MIREKETAYDAYNDVTRDGYYMLCISILANVTPEQAFIRWYGYAATNKAGMLDEDRQYAASMSRYESAREMNDLHNDGYSFREIAEMTGVKPGTVETYISKFKHGKIKKTA